MIAPRGCVSIEEYETIISQSSLQRAGFMDIRMKSTAHLLAPADLNNTEALQYADCPSL